MKGKAAIFAMALFFLIPPAGFAKGKDELKQIKQIRVVGLDTLKNYNFEYVLPDEELDDIFGEKLDSLSQTWYVQNIFGDDNSGLSSATNIGIVYPDSVYIEKLKEIQQVIPLPYNNAVKDVIELYTVRKRNQVEIMLGLSAFYFPVFEEVLDKYDLPLELKYLPVIESALNPRARSRVGATGLWQFMYNTGKILKLDIDSYIDERRDLLSSTEAAARYLKQLYSIYNDWHLVIAAYNCGPGNLNRAIKRCGGKTDYWSVYYRLPRETRGFVPAFIAASYVMNFYKDHNLTPRLPTHPLYTDTIMVNNPLNLNQVASGLNIDIEQLRDLNPVYRTDVIPAKEDNPFPLRLPQDAIGNFIDNQQLIFSLDRDKYFPDNSVIIPKTQAASLYEPINIKGKEKIYYTVKPGDNIGFISEWFSVRASDIRYWNNINRNLIRAGQKLLIYVDANKKEKYAQVDSMDFSAKQLMIGASPTASAAQVAEPVNTESDSEYIYYTVEKGDNLWDIAKKFPGTSNYDIMHLNKITDARSLYIGQKLKIKKKA